MNNNSTDNSSFKVAEDGTIIRVGKIESKKSNNSKTILWIFLILATIISIGLGIILFVVNEDLTYYQQEYYRISNNLQNENTNLQSENSALKNLLPITYTVTAYRADCYDLYGDNNFDNTGYYYENGTSLEVYTIRNGYGLTNGGWLRMQDLKKQ